MAFYKRKDDFRGIGEFVEDIFDRSFPFKVGKIDFPLINLYTTNETYVVQLASPGSKKEDFSISFEGYKIKVAYEPVVVEEEEREYKTREFGYKKIEKTYNLPEDIDKDNIAAKFENGLLSIIIPKVERENSEFSKNIDID